MTEPQPREQERLEGAVGEQVVHAGAVGAQAAGHHHVAQLAHGRIGHHAFDVGLGQGDGCAQHHGQPADQATTVMAVGDRL